MYKTVRHGENSLQYTILPQTEEVLNNSGLKGIGRDYSPSIHVRRIHRKSTLNCLTVALVGVTVMLGLAIVLMYVINSKTFDFPHRNIQIPQSDIIISTKPLSPADINLIKSRKKELKTYPEGVPLSKSRMAQILSSTTGTTIISSSMPDVTKPSPVSSSSPPELPRGIHDNIPLAATLSNDVSSQFDDKPVTTQMPNKEHTKPPEVQYDPIANVMTINLFANIPVIKDTTTEKTTSTDSVSSGRSKFKDLKDTLLSVDDDDEFKDSLEIDDVFSIPSLKPNLEPESDDVSITVSKPADNAWYGARWPFVDTSSYFQWTVSNAVKLDIVFRKKSGTLWLSTKIPSPHRSECSR